MNIFLIGYRCTGKTTIGRLLSQKLARPFIDTDQQVEKKCGQPIAQIVAESGWDGFRDAEKKILKQVCASENQVVATGGGIILDPANIALMKKTGVVIWLQADLQTIESRLAEDAQTKAQRPSLTGGGLLDEIAQVLVARGPLYTRAMDVAIDTGEGTPQDCCAKAIDALRRLDQKI